MFGRYSNGFQGRLTKRDMIESAHRAHPGELICAARKLENNTLGYRIGLVDYVRHFQTDILAIDAGAQRFTVYMGGWNSVTTRGRLSAYLPSDPAGAWRWSIWTDKGTPWLAFSRKTTRAVSAEERAARPWLGETDYHWEHVARFALDPQEPATFATATGEHVGGVLSDQHRTSEGKRLLSAFIAKARKGDFADPAGDPWLFNAEPPAADTLRDWLSGGYVTWAAVARALEWSKAGPAAFSMARGSVERGRGLPDFACNALRRWIKKGMGL